MGISPMKKMHVFIIIISILVIIGGGLYWFLNKNPLPQILTSLPTQIDQQSAAFNQRIVTRFPAGSSETNLTNELQKEGFAVKTPNGDSHSATYTHYGNLFLDPFRRDASVTWKTDSHGIITTISGTYFVTGP
jgi:hypothetical protein